MGERGFALESTYFFFNDLATSEIYTLSLHDALPICERFISGSAKSSVSMAELSTTVIASAAACPPDRKSTRLNSSHGYISYAVFCLKKKRLGVPVRPRRRHPHTRVRHSRSQGRSWIC